MVLFFSFFFLISRHLTDNFADHPLHKGDDPWVFTTEGHPLIFPKSPKRPTWKPAPLAPFVRPPVCDNPRHGSITFFSPTASRPDTFHAAQFTRYHLLPKTPPLGQSPLQPSDLDIHAENSFFWSPTNSTFYPWTLPPHLIHPDSVCAPLPGRESFELIFPSVSTTGFAGDGTAGIVKRVSGGVMVSGSMRGIRMGLIKESDDLLRVTSVGGTTLGKGETVFLEQGLVDKGNGDANFQVIADNEFVDLIIEIDDDEVDEDEWEEGGEGGYGYEFPDTGLAGQIPLVDKSTLGELLSKLGFDMQISDFLALVGGDSTSAIAGRQKTLAVDPTTTASSKPVIPRKKQKVISAIMATGVGVYPPPDSPTSTSNPSQLAFSTIHFSDTACSPSTVIPPTAQVVFVRRGECTFLQKIRNIPDTCTVKLLVVIDAAQGRDDELVRPLLDERVDRKWGLSVIMVAGMGDTAKAVRDGTVKAVGVRWRWRAYVKGGYVGNLVVL